ncbi:unnamed protein product [Linum tenue]|uniref:6,7-dimethyl-8-ribityllumazine synthase n=1 Tax=Linum tenue TaxID=586396 RepID=A0AAV0IRE6_9ROSI|nr:unnamed protein product [Linum tenue]
MGNTLRCCLACVIPCGALDLIRIVHLNGYVEEITRPVTAGEILQANPNHVLSKPSSQGVVRRILILSPDSELKRGGIYFLIPETSMPDKKRIRRAKSAKKYRHKTTTTTTDGGDDNDKNNQEGHHVSVEDHCERYLTEPVITEEKKEKKQKHHRRSGTGRSGVWRPYLDSITED